MTEKIRLKIRPQGESIEIEKEGETPVSLPREEVVRFAKAIVEADRTGDHITVEVTDIP